MLIRHFLKKLGAEVEIVVNGRQAVESAREASWSGQPFDLILMDMQMPELDGYSATRELRDAGYLGPILALTANAMSDDASRCREAGCDDYATKPIQRAMLAEQIRRLIFAQGQSEPCGKRTDSASAASDGIRTSDPPVFDRAIALDRCGSDEELLCEVMEVFLESLPQLQKELQNAIEKDDRNAIRRLTHTLKGSADSLGGQQLHSNAAQWERASQKSFDFDFVGNWPSLRTRIDVFASALAKELAAVPNEKQR